MIKELMLIYQLHALLHFALEVHHYIVFQKYMLIEKLLKHFISYLFDPNLTIIVILYITYKQLSYK